MAGQSSWMRFTGHDKTILAQVVVPKITPDWFLETLKKINAVSSRELKMEDISVRQWVDFQIAANVPIRVRTPLLTKLVKEEYWVSKAEAEAAAELNSDGELVNFDTSKITKVLTTSEMSRLQDAGQLQALGEMVQIHHDTLGRPAAQRILHLPMLDPNTERDTTFALMPNSFMCCVEQAVDGPLQAVADGVYSVITEKKVQLLTS
jgi:hypothetical protein